MPTINDCVWGFRRWSLHLWYLYFLAEIDNIAQTDFKLERQKYVIANKIY